MIKKKLASQIIIEIKIEIKKIKMILTFREKQVLIIVIYSITQSILEQINDILKLSDKKVIPIANNPQRLISQTTSDNLYNNLNKQLNVSPNNEIKPGPISDYNEIKIIAFKKAKNSSVQNNVNERSCILVKFIYLYRVFKLNIINMNTI